MKLLWISVAALTAAFAASPALAADEEGLKLKINGFYEGFLEFGGTSGTAPGLQNLRNVTVESWNAEIHFKAEGQAANGLKYGFVIELEGSTQDNQIDESYIWLSDSFGRAILGNEDGVANTGYRVPSATKSKAIKLEGQDYNPANPGGGHLLPKFTSPSNFSSDASKLIYFSPRFSGIQLGVSYAPDLSKHPATSGTGAAVQGGFESDVDAQAGDALELLATYKEKFDKLGVDLAFTYYRDQVEDDDGSAAGIARRASADDRQSYYVGGGISYEGFSIGASYQYTDNYRAQSYASPGYKDVTLDQFLVGALYVTGPWSFGVNLGYGVVDVGPNSFAGNVDREDELFAGIVGVGYALTPGISLDAGVQYYDWSSSSTSATADKTREGSATAVLIGTVLTF